MVGLDLSPAMLERARRAAHPGDVSFILGDFLEVDVGAVPFDCIVSAATVHHMPADRAIARMVRLLRPGGRLIVHDLRRNVGVADSLRATVAFAHAKTARLLRTGRARPPRALRKAWQRHGAGEHYLSLAEARALADAYLPGAIVLNHWLWRYTIVWTSPRGCQR